MLYSALVCLRWRVGSEWRVGKARGVRESGGVRGARGDSDDVRGAHE